MPVYLTPEQRDQGRANTNAAAAELTRRGFMKSAAIGGAAATLGAVGAGTYFGYKAVEGKPLKAALIGCGDEGGILMNEVDPKFVEFIALCDIRPTNKKRIIDGEGKTTPRRGYAEIYGKDAAARVKNGHIYDDYVEMLQKEKDLEAVVIALPLHLHYPATMEALKRGKHVLCEKLMARTVTQCKEMIKAAKQHNRILSIGHQRHYSMLYAHAVEMIQAGLLGDIKHIRALWHRNFSWPWVNDGKKKIVTDSASIKYPTPMYRDGWFQPIVQEDYEYLKDKGLSRFDYKSIEELVRWRLYQRTGGGLMAELGSHQLDACSIFLGKVKPLSVMGTGTRSFFGDSAVNNDARNPREIDDQVFVTYEFPGKNHPKAGKGGNDPNDVVVVTYSSITTNGFEPYGECVMGSRGTMVVSSESELLLFKEQQPGRPDPAKSTQIAVSNVGGKPALEAASTWGGPPPTAVGGAVTGATAGERPSRGYNEEMADFAYCIRQWDEKLGYAGDPDQKGKYQQRLPRCHGEVAMADAILALTANLAMAGRRRIEFQDDWFAADKSDVPDKDVNFNG